jgi:hypothetical protein
MFSPGFFQESLGMSLPFAFRLASATDALPISFGTQVISEIGSTTCSETHTMLVWMLTF